MANEMKNNYCLFESLKKKARTAFSFIEYLFSVLGIFTFLYYVNKVSDDVIRFAARIVKY